MVSPWTTPRRPVGEGVWLAAARGAEWVARIPPLAALGPTDPFQPFSNRLSDGAGHRLAGQVREFADKSESLGVLDVEAHGRNLP